MRMWMVNPKLLCRNHLLGEHSEIHKHRHNFEKKHSISKRVFTIAQIEPSSMKKRHDELVVEMQRRNYNHNSPYEMPDISYLPPQERDTKVNVNVSVNDLIERCPCCRRNLMM